MILERIRDSKKNEIYDFEVEKEYYQGFIDNFDEEYERILDEKEYEIRKKYEAEQKNAEKNFEEKLNKKAKGYKIFYWIGVSIILFLIYLLSWYVLPTDVYEFLDDMMPAILIYLIIISFSFRKKSVVKRGMKKYKKKLISYENRESYKLEIKKAQEEALEKCTREKDQAPQKIAEINKKIEKLQEEYAVTPEKIIKVLKLLINDRELDYENIIDKISDYLDEVKLGLQDVYTYSLAAYLKDEMCLSNICLGFYTLCDNFVPLEEYFIELRKVANHIVYEISSEGKFEAFVDQIANELHYGNSLYSNIAEARIAARSGLLEQMTSMNSPKVQMIVKAVQESYEHMLSKKSFIPKGDPKRGVFEYVDSKDIKYLLSTIGDSVPTKEILTDREPVKCKEFDEFIECVLKLYAKMYILDENIYELHTSKETAEQIYLNAVSARVAPTFTRTYTQDVLPRY